MKTSNWADDLRAYLKSHDLQPRQVTEPIKTRRPDCDALSPTDFLLAQISFRAKPEFTCTSSTANVSIMSSAVMICGFHKVCDKLYEYTEVLDIQESEAPESTPVMLYAPSGTYMERGAVPCIHNTSVSHMGGSGGDKTLSGVWSEVKHGFSPGCQRI
ncbi:hypothetical protein RRG08_063239 [Elysia crispata]|uniref:Uncharacterized protein n=1 Tax=Elysia crispata TaxID=231223 RepID=A0AAE0Y9Y0_9GAST|nr:hypothetical protein RRG08_063239 [Elysia crispata]